MIMVTIGDLLLTVMLVFMEHRILINNRGNDLHISSVGP